jgi:predicted nucleic acid-binding protein
MSRIKLPDAIIAATAIYLDLPLLTFDSDFHNIPELKLMILKP